MDSCLGCCAGQCNGSLGGADCGWEQAGRNEAVKAQSCDTDSGRNGALNWARRGNAVIQDVTAGQERSVQLV